MRKESWADIAGWEGFYQISDKGRIKSFKQNKEGKVRSVKNRTGWYLNVVLTDGEKYESIKVHVLVARTFLPNLYGYQEVDHIDGNKQNNRVENLEWVSHAENLRRDALRNPERVAGMKRHNRSAKAIPVVQRDMQGRVVSIYPNVAEASRETGVCGKNIHQVASQEEYKPGRVRKQAGGYAWEFLK